MGTWEGTIPNLQRFKHSKLEDYQIMQSAKQHNSILDSILELVTARSVLGSSCLLFFLSLPSSLSAPLARIFKLSLVTFIYYHFNFAQPPLIKSHFTTSNKTQARNLTHQQTKPLSSNFSSFLLLSLHGSW